MAKITNFECSRCHAKFPAAPTPTVCPQDGEPLYVRYDLGEIRWHASRDSLIGGPKSMWRYAAILPDAEPVSLGEGFTPLLRSRKHPNLFIKNEGLNPTGTFEARGISAAITMLRLYGVKKVAASPTGDAAGALAAYAAAAGLEAYVFMPKDAPMANRLEVEAAGAHLTLVDGGIGDCDRMLAERKEKEGWFDVSPFKEPFCMEGMKTMGYEVAEQMGWSVPDAIVFPRGNGVGMIGIWKAFEEMGELGWIERGRRPKMICARYADFLILDIIRESSGTGVAVSDNAIVDAVKELASSEGIFACPEGGAALAAYKQLLDSGFLRPSDKVVLFNSASGYKYLDVMAKYWSIDALGAERKLPAGRNMGGIIAPY